MKTKDYVTIIIRLMVIGLLIISTQTIIGAISFLSQGNGYFIDSVLAVLLPILLALLLWFLSPKLATLVTSDISTQAKIQLNTEGFLRCLIIICGFYLLLNSVLNASYWFFNNWIFKANPELSGTVDTIQIQQTFLATSIVRFILSLFILAKNQWITQALLKINAPEKPELDDDSV